MKSAGRNPESEAQGPKRPPVAVPGPQTLDFGLLSWIAGAFTFFVALALVVSHLGSKLDDPLNSPQLKQAKEQLRLNPVDAQLKQRIRQLDLELRQRYFRHLSRMGSGIYMLLGGAAVLLFAQTRRARALRQLPMPQPKPEAPEHALRAAARARWSVAASGVGIGAFLVVVGFSAVPKRSAETEAAPGSTETHAATPDAASADEHRRNWPRFRGPGGNGLCLFTNLPVEWNTNTGAGIAWKVPVPAGGFSSPVAWGGRIFSSGGDGKKREVFCLEAETGRLLWRQAVAGGGTGEPRANVQEIPDSTGYAAATPATDGRRVYAMFATGEMAAFTLEGKPVWSKNFGPIKNPYGFATSLASWQDRVLLQLDQGESDEAKSKLYALDGRTGQITWQRPRKVGSSWATPIVIEAASKIQVITLSVPWVIAYSVLDGSELWRVDCLNGEVTPSPVFAGGMVIVASPSEKLVAIRPDGQGDVTKSHLAWTSEENVPDVTSPVSDGELVFTLTTGGMLTCLDIKDGRKQWDHDFETEFHTSPSIAGGRIYLFSQKGTAIVVDAGRQFKERFRTEMGDAFHASPAFLEDRIVVRGLANFWCLEKGTGSRAENLERSETGHFAGAWRIESSNLRLLLNDETHPPDVFRAPEPGMRRPGG